MTDERDIERLRDQAPEPPPELIAGARAEASGLRAGRRRMVRARIAIAAAAGALLVGASLTPPGRAATGWIADLAGVGEKPTLEQQGAVEGSAVVLTSGVLPDDTGYEVVAKRVNLDSIGFEQGPPLAPPPGLGDAAEDAQEHLPAAASGLVCLQVDFPGVTERGEGGHCTDGSLTGDGIGTESGGLFQRPDSSGAAIQDHDSAGLLLAMVEPEFTDDVRVFELHPDGTRRGLSSELIVLDPQALERVGADSVRAILVAELDAETVIAGNRGQIEIRAVAFGAAGEEIGHEDINFRPASCPDSPRRPPPPPPAGRSLRGNVEPAAPVEPSESDQPFTDICPPMLQAIGPPKFTAHELEADSAPVALVSEARRHGLALRPPTSADINLVHTPGAELRDVDSAAQRVTGPATELLGGATMGLPRVYLARLKVPDRLVYVAEFTVRSVQLGRGWDRLPEPRQFLAIVDATSGETLHFGEVA